APGTELPLNQSLQNLIHSAHYAGGGNRYIRNVVIVVVKCLRRLADIAATVLIAVELPERSRNDRRVRPVGAVVDVVRHSVAVRVVLHRAAGTVIDQALLLAGLRTEGNAGLLLAARALSGGGRAQDARGDAAVADLRAAGLSHRARGVGV